VRFVKIKASQYAQQRNIKESKPGAKSSTLDIIQVEAARDQLWRKWTAGLAPCVLTLAAHGSTCMQRLFQEALIVITWISIQGAFKLTCPTSSTFGESRHS
jgi:hypothetical protein